MGTEARMAADSSAGFPPASRRPEDADLDEEAIVREIDAALERIHISLQEQHAVADALLERLSRPAR